MTFFNLRHAHEILLNNIEKVATVESVGLLEADGRVLAEDLIAKRNLPPFDNSAMDGYAVKLCDEGKKVEVIGAIFAGDKAVLDPMQGKAVKIMTGAMVPQSAQAVVPFEKTTIDGEMVLLPESIKAGQNIRRTGEEIGVNSLLFAKGTRLDPAKIALIASQGVMALKVHTKLKVTVVSGGDEIVEPWQMAEDHQIFNTNSTSLVLSVKHAGFDAVYASIGKDSVEKLASAIQEAIASSDVVLTTGGVSEGYSGDGYAYEGSGGWFEAQKIPVIFSLADAKKSAIALGLCLGNNLDAAAIGRFFEAEIV